jgi:hypothetical protein
MLEPHSLDEAVVDLLDAAGAVLFAPLSDSAERGEATHDSRRAGQERSHSVEVNQSPALSSLASDLVEVVLARPRWSLDRVGPALLSSTACGHVCHLLPAAPLRRRLVSADQAELAVEEVDLGAAWAGLELS